MGRHSKKVLSVMLSGLLATSMFAALPAAASAAEGSGSEAGLSAGQVAGVSSQSTVLPADFDLRNRGVVTPVKKQDPWSTCWSFASIAAAEISILSMLQDKGQAIDAKDFNLSEKHLAWFGTHPITGATDSAQAGEGMYVTNKEDVPNITYDNGGYGVNVSTLFSSGVGPVYEKYFPYQGKEGLTEKQYLAKHAELGKTVAREAGEAQMGITLEEAVQNPGNEAVQKLLSALRNGGYLTVDDSELTVEMLEDALYKMYVDKLASNNCYTSLDDWSIPETTIIEGQEVLSRNAASGFTLVDGNKLPALSNKDSNGKWKSVNWDGVNALKSELMLGHGVTAGFKADTATPGEVAENPMMNEDTWAHYTYEDLKTTHMICIVGWNDDYPAGNFLEGHLPPGNGAWLVKNSWGSEYDYTELEDGGTINYDPWGIVDESGKHNGYFWISYYDKSLDWCESLSFDADFADTDGELLVQMYDYMPSLVGVRTGQDTSEQSESLLKTANVFKNDMGTYAQLASVSTKTARPNATVKYSVYQLGKNAKNPEDGMLLGTKTVTYDYAGFHREKLDGSIMLKDGETFAIVAEETVTENGKQLYEYAANISYSKAHAEAVKAKEAAEGIDTNQRDRNADEYGVAVVNEGESFIYDNDAWTDWAEYAPRTQLANDYAIDNFSIKAYLVAKKDIAECTISGVKAKTFNGKKQTQDITVKDGAATLKEGADYTVSYKDNKYAGEATVTVRGEGAYAGEAARAFTIKKAKNPVTARGKVLTASARKATSFGKARAFAISKAKGDVTFKKASGNSKITVAKKTGKVTVRKGLKKGKTYKLKVKVTAAGTKNYKKATRTATVTVRVK